MIIIDVQLHDSRINLHWTSTFGLREPRTGVSFLPLKPGLLILLVGLNKTTYALSQSVPISLLDSC